MEFQDKYTTDDKETKKILISKDSYAICEMLDLLIKKAEELRVKE